MRGRWFRYALVCVALFVAASASAQTGVTLNNWELVKVKKTWCGHVKGKWIPGTPSKGLFVSTAARISAYNKQLRSKQTSAKKKGQIRSQLAKLNASLKTAAKICRALRAPVIPVATPVPGASPIAWERNAFDLKGQLGAELLYFCPANPVALLTNVWGHDVYSTDSFICVAGVHAGQVNRLTGGNVKIRVKGSQNLFTGSIRNSVQSSFYGPYESSFVFLDLATNAELITSSVPQISWTQGAQPFRELAGSFTYLCGAEGAPGSIWGTDTYTDDSSICTAAVHAGKISLKDGGVITIEARPGEATYVGSTRHGVTSASYGEWGASFIFR